MSSLVNCSQLLIKSPKAKLHLILNARFGMPYENPVVQIWVQIVQIRAQNPNYYNKLGKKIQKTPRQVTCAVLWKLP